MTWQRRKSIGTEFIFQNNTIVIFDVETDFSVSSTTSVTEYPVEEGYNITDHAKNDPLTIEVKGYVSDSAFGPGNNRDVETYNLLDSNKRNLVLCSILSDGVLYENLIITSLSIPRTVDTGEGTEFNVSLKQIVVVNRRIVTTDDLENPPRNGGTGNIGEIASARDTLTGKSVENNAQKGNPAYVDVQVKNEEKDSSVLYDLLN